MQQQKYNWNRFWTQRDGTFRMTAKGYLADPEGPYGNILNPETETLEALADVPCLVLLGEPGIGKSEEISQARTLMNSRIADRGTALHYELRDFQTDLKLSQDIFDSPEFRSWIPSKERLYLFLDSLDEGLLTISTLATLLTRELKKYPPDRLYLRITCRTAEWPDILEQGLKQHWGVDAFKAYELLPLREKDVIDAARAESIDAAKFLQDLDQKEVVPLSIKPVTLKFLLNTYKKHGQLPQTQSDLYLQGCRYLCEETNKSRLASKRKGHLNASQRSQEQRRRHTWAPLQPSTIIELAVNEDLRLVQNGAQLLDVLIESLKRLEIKLRAKRRQPLTYGTRSSAEFINRKMKTGCPTI